MDGNGDRIGFLRALSSLVRAPFEERMLREEVARNERLQYVASSRMLEQVVRRVEPEDDEFTQLLYGAEHARELDEETAKSLRVQAMKAWLKSPHARGYLESLKRFVMGKGPQFVPEVDDDKLRGRINSWWSEFKRINNWDMLEDEIPVRTWRDGETFVRKFTHATDGPVDADLNQETRNYLARHNFDVEDALGEEIPAGMTFLRLVPPDQIEDPENIISHGIVTAGKDVRTVLGYVWAVDGKVKEIIKAPDVLHTKIGVDSDVKRGRSILEIILKNDKRFDDWLNYRIMLNLARTAIVLVKKIEGTAAQVQGVRDAQAKQLDTTTSSRKLQMLKPMTTIHANPGISYEFKNPQIHAQDAAQDGRALLLTMAAASGLPEYMFTGDACFDEETEILTRRGWLKLDEVGPDERVGTVNPKTWELEYQKPIRWWANRHEGPMVHLTGKATDTLVTPNHRLLLGREKWQRIVWGKEYAGDVHRGNLIFHTLLGFNWTCGPPRESYCVPGVGRTPMSKFLRFLGYYVGDGSVTHGKSRVAVAGISKERKLEAYGNTLDSLGFKRHVAPDQRHHWYQDNHELHDWLSAIVGDGAQNKQLPEFVHELPKEQLQILFDALTESDGYRSTKGTARIYTTSSQRLADDIQLLALKLGLRAHVRDRVHDDNSKGEGPYWRVETSADNTIRLRRDRNIKAVPYRGGIWCAEVPNGLLVTRRNGMVAIHGNSNASYSSTMVAESPAVREFESWQDFYTPTFTHIWRWVIEAGVDHGQIDGLSIDKAKELELSIEWPPMMSRDEVKHTEANRLRHQGGILSKEGWATDDGIDWNVERERLEKELKEANAGPIGDLIKALGQLSASGILTPDRGLEMFIRNALGAPALRGEEPSE